MKLKIINSKLKMSGGVRGRGWKLVALFILNFAFLLLNLPAEDSPREVFNAGTKLLRAGKLKDAEDALQRAVASQDDRVQAAALYNLGLVRVAQGAEILKTAE